jgi:hypothetical protein
MEKIKSTLRVLNLDAHIERKVTNHLQQIGPYISLSPSMIQLSLAGLLDHE